MLIVKPEWVCHLDEKNKKAPIYSLHVHPDGTRLATGAQDSKVKIWNLSAMTEPDMDVRPDTKKHLCTMSLHGGAVLCVKWSNGEGKYLASGSDDMIVMIWQLDRTSEAWGGGSFGSSDGPNVENWRGVKRLAGHESDVTEVAWSHENAYLASAGLDSKIIIWDGKTFDRVIKLDQHQGFVKGLTWDPVGKYLASQSDDRSVRIWRITDWEVEVEITEPFAQSAGTTFFRRLSWSPDGGHIATANALNGSIPVAAVITRDNWKADISLVGHGAPVEVVSFNPLLFKITDANGDIGFTSICAVGSQDRGLTVWRTHEARPFVGIKDIFDHSILDLSWTPNGQTLFACSYDGTIALILFATEGMGGEPVPAEERHRLLAKYGYERRGEIMAETPVQLAMEEKLKNPIQSRMDEAMNPESSMEGVTSTFSAPSDPSVFASASGSGSTSSAVAATSEAIVAAPVLQAVAAPVINVASQQTVTITSDGKKRIRPLFLGNGMGSNPIMSGPSTPTIISGGSSSHHISNGLQGARPISRVELGEPSSSIPEGGFQTVVVGMKRKEGPQSASSSLSNQSLPNKKGSDSTSTSMSGGAKGKSGGLASRSKDEEVVTRPAVAAPLVNVSKIRLGLPRVKSHITRNRFGLECHNSITNDTPTKVMCSQRGTILWTDYLPSPVLIMAGNVHFSAVACEDGSIYVYSPAGRRLLPCIVLESAASFLECDGEFLMCLTACGLVSSWNVMRQEAVVSSISIGPILHMMTLPADAATTSVSITLAAVSKTSGLPMLTTSSGHGYTYHSGMNVWVRAVDAWFATSSFFGVDPAGASAHRIGGFGNGDHSMLSSTSSLQHKGKGPLADLQSGATGGRLERDVSFAQNLLHVDEAVQSVITISHLENQMAAACVMNSPAEYRQWLRCYCQRLAKDGATTRVEELCKFLLGPVYGGGERSGWDPEILGFRKRELLAEILPILSSNRLLQRIVKEYADASAK